MFVSPKKSPYFDYRFNDNNVLNLSGRYEYYSKEGENYNQRNSVLNQFRTTSKNQKPPKNFDPRPSLLNQQIGKDQQNDKAQDAPITLNNERFQKKIPIYGDFYRSMSISSPNIYNSKNEINKEEYSKKLLSNCLNYRQWMKELSRSNLLELGKHQELINYYNTKPYNLKEPPVFYQIDKTPEREYSRENIREKNRNKIVEKFPLAFTPREVM